MGFTVPTKWADKRHDGQVPRHDMHIERASIMRLVEKPPPPYSIDRFFERPVMSPGAAMDDLGLDQGTLNSWVKFLQDVVYSSDYEVAVRQQIMERLQQEAWDPQLRKVVMQRALQLHRDTAARKSIVTVDELRKALGKNLEPPEEPMRFELRKSRLTDKRTKRSDVEIRADVLRKRENLDKADAKGGTFHRRVPKKGGGYRYFYDETKYSNSKDAHHSGSDLRKQAMGRDIDSHMEAAGSEGCHVKTMKPLAKKYGRAELSDELRSRCKNGGLLHKKGVFTKGKS